MPFAAIATAPPPPGPKMDWPVHWTQVPTSSRLTTVGPAGAAGSAGWPQPGGTVATCGGAAVVVVTVVVEGTVEGVGTVVTVGTVVGVVVGPPWLALVVVVEACTPLVVVDGCVAFGSVEGVGRAEEVEVEAVDGPVPGRLVLARGTPALVPWPGSRTRDESEPETNATTTLAAAIVAAAAVARRRLRIRAARSYTQRRNSSGSFGWSGGSVRGNQWFPGFLEERPECFAPSMEVCLHAADRDSHGPGDLRFAVIEVVAQDEGTPLSFRDGP